MLNRARYWLRGHPHLYDLSVRARRVLGIRTIASVMFNEFSLCNGRTVRFIQIGASDGLHSDPIREFVVRDHWSGTFVEPLPNSFTRLKRNYHYLQRPNLTFVNAAVATSNTSTASIWTFSETFLTGMPDSERMNYVQKSSFNPDHVLGGLGTDATAKQAVIEIAVPCLTLSDLVGQNINTPTIDLLVTDLEGYEATLIPSIDFRTISPKAIFYESHNLGQNEAVVSDFLTTNGYHVFRLVGDSLALKAEFLATWQVKSSWALQNLVSSNSRPQETVKSSMISQQARP